MKVLIKQAAIICPSSPFHGQVKDILIQDGIIVSIDNIITATDSTIIDHKGLELSLGWMDSFAHFCDPGMEYKETLETGAAAAAAGGYTDVMIIPNTKPIIDTKSPIEYIVQKAKGLSVNIHPIAAITKNTEGKELAEMYDMHESGAIAFGDGTASIQNAGLLLKALQYVKTFDGTVIQVPDDRSAGAHGLMNEGIISTQLGIPGRPAIAEELMVARDIMLSKYTESKLHFTGVSTAKSLEFIQRAKAAGALISCSTTPYHLFFTEEDLQDYDTNLKVNPPLRTKADREALRKAVAAGTIDCIASHHLPQNTDNKICEFENAGYGMIGLETAFSIVMSTGCSVERFVEMQTISNRNLFGLPIPEIKEGARACLTLFDSTENWVLKENKIVSKSRNSPFIGQPLKGKVIGIINGNKTVLNS